MKPGVEKKKGGRGGERGEEGGEEIKKMAFSLPGRAVPHWWFWKPLEALWDVANSSTVTCSAGGQNPRRGGPFCQADS